MTLHHHPSQTQQEQYLSCSSPDFEQTLKVTGTIINRARLSSSICQGIICPVFNSIFLPIVFPAQKFLVSNVLHSQIFLHTQLIGLTITENQNFCHNPILTTTQLNLNLT